MKKITSIILLVLLAAGTLFAFNGTTISVTGGYGFKQGFVLNEKKMMQIKSVMHGPKVDLNVLIPITYEGNFGIEAGASALFAIKSGVKYFDFKNSASIGCQPNIDADVLARWHIGNETVQFMPAVGLAAGYSKWNLLSTSLSGGFEFGITGRLGLTVVFSPLVHLNFNIHDTFYFVDKSFRKYLTENIKFSPTNALSANIGVGFTF